MRIVRSCLVVLAVLGFSAEVRAAERYFKYTGPGRHVTRSGPGRYGNHELRTVSLLPGERYSESEIHIIVRNREALGWQFAGYETATAADRTAAAHEAPGAAKRMDLLHR